MALGTLLVATAACPSQMSPCLTSSHLWGAGSESDYLRGLLGERQNAIYARPIIVVVRPLPSCAAHRQPEASVETSVHAVGYEFDVQAGYARWTRVGRTSCTQFAAHGPSGPDGRATLGVCLEYVGGPTQCSVMIAAVAALRNPTSPEARHVLDLSETLRSALRLATPDGNVH